MSTTPEPTPCPECGGVWLRNLVFRHKPNGCTIGYQEDKTQNADSTRLEDCYEFTRPSTQAEILLHNHISGTEFITAQTTVLGPTALRERTITQI